MTKIIIAASLMLALQAGSALADGTPLSRPCKTYFELASAVMKNGDKLYHPAPGILWIISMTDNTAFVFEASHDPHARKAPRWWCQVAVKKGAEV